MADDGEDIANVQSEVTSELKRIERWISRIFGALLGAGVIGAVFKSDNQAGTTALVLVSGVLLLLAITGTPIIRAKYGDKEIEFARKRGRALAEAVKDEPKEVIERTAAALDSVDPIAASEVRKSQSSILASAYAFEDRLHTALLEVIGGQGLLASPEIDAGLDFIAKIGDGVIGVEAKYRRSDRKISANDVQQAIGILHSTGIKKVLLVANAPATQSALAIAKESGVTLIEWQGATDNDRLAHALDL